MSTEFEVRRDHRIRRIFHPFGEHTPPDECDHPIEARVWPYTTGYIARCNDCGASLTRGGQWLLVRV